MPAPWERYATNPQAPVPGASQAPAGVIAGTPRPRLPAAQTEAQAVQDQYQAVAAPHQARAAAANATRAEVEAAQAQRAAQDPANGASVEQRRAGGFYNRAALSNQVFERLNVTPRDPLTQMAADVAPQTIVNWMTGPERQQAEAAMRNFVAATLRYESGAAIPPEELATQARIFFPMPGDTPETIRLKAEMRRNAIESLQIGAGTAADAASPSAAQPQAPAVGNARAVGAAVPGAVDEDILDIGALGGVSGYDPSGIERPAAPGLGQQLLDSTVNTVAGIGQGIAAIPDAAANALGAVLAIPADWAGLDFVADNLRRPITIGGAIERAAPTPDNFGGQVARVGAQVFGGAASLPQRAQNALTSQFVGHVPTRPTAPNALAPRGQVMDDARRLDIPMMPADVGGPFTRLSTAAAAQTPGGVRPIVNAARNTSAAASRALDRTARGVGAPTNFEEAGEAATRGALRYRETSRLAASRLYDQATQAAEGVRVPPQGAIQALERHIAELSENPAGEQALGFLNNLRLGLSQSGGVTVQGIRGMRTQLRDRFFSEGLRGTDIERRVMEVVDAASDDVTAALTNAGRSEAANLYRSADRAWAARADALDNVIMPIIGRRGEKSGEQVFRTLQETSRGNGERLRRFVQALPEEEAGTVRASLISGLGRARAQNADGDAFSLDTFLTNWSNLSPSVRRNFFDRNTQSALQSLARVAENTRAAGAYANRSRTGGAVVGVATGASAYAGGLPVLATVLAAQYGAGRLLASPAVARVLARVGSARSPQEAQGAIRALGSIGARNPAVASEVGDLQRRLMEAFSTSPAPRAAAQENEQVR